MTKIKPTCSGTLQELTLTIIKQIPLILLFPRIKLLNSPAIKQLCITADKARNTLAISCLSFFVALVSIVVFHRAVPFEYVPPIAITAFSCFTLSAILAFRFGRLCDAEKSIKYKSNIEHMCRMQPKCLEYYNRVHGVGRPFTRLDLEELGRIYLKNPGPRDVYKHR